ncbi:sentrin-specific protease 8-like isoform X2 [Apostichopus japonicus]|uniref:sentrin-specific protease 8-like isoform X2 n=1 Tax=Stichopus japonicus TaxID=307972 RepID=UPI003AB74025
MLTIVITEICNCIMADEIVVSFHNSLLRESDVSLLDGPRWLNDKLIGFAFEYFEHTAFAGKVDNIAIISPEVTQFIKLSAESEIGVFVNPLDLPQKDYIFLAVNNNSSYSSVGGSHWSLLVFSKEDQSFMHFDPLHKSNAQDAKQLVLQLQPLVTDTGMANYVEMSCPQQENGF